MRCLVNVIKKNIAQCGSNSEETVLHLRIIVENFSKPFETVTDKEKSTLVTRSSDKTEPTVCGGK